MPCLEKPSLSQGHKNINSCFLSMVSFIRVEIFDLPGILVLKQENVSVFFLSFLSQMSNQFFAQLLLNNQSSLTGMKEYVYHVLKVLIYFIYV